MKNRSTHSGVGGGNKAHQSDDEDEITQQQVQEVEKKKEPEMSQEEIERRQLEHAPVIGDSEISPAAYLFHNQEEHDDLNLFESQ